MNDGKSSAENPTETNERTEDLFELGSVKEETKGHFLGSFFDGGSGWWG